MTDCTAWWCLSDAALRHLDTLGVWIGSAATFAAVVVSLWLARRSERIVLRGSVSIGLLYGSGLKTAPRFVWIQITNVGRRPAKITYVGWESDWWRFGRWKKRYAMQKLDAAAHSNVSQSPMPITLEDGDTAHYRVPLVLPDGTDWLKH